MEVKMEVGSPNVWVSVWFEDNPPVATEVSNQKDASSNIHKFIENICSKIHWEYNKNLILLLEPDSIIFDVSTIEEGDWLLIVPRDKLKGIMEAETEKKKQQLFFKLIN